VGGTCGALVLLVGLTEGIPLGTRLGGVEGVLVETVLSILSPVGRKVDGLVGKGVDSAVGVAVESTEGLAEGGLDGISVGTLIG
jgi:hypothetical protein